MICLFFCTQHIYDHWHCVQECLLAPLFVGAVRSVYSAVEWKQCCCLFAMSKLATFRSINKLFKCEIRRSDRLTLCIVVAGVNRKKDLTIGNIWF